MTKHTNEQRKVVRIFSLKELFSKKEQEQSRINRSRVSLVQIKKKLKPSDQTQQKLTGYYAQMPSSKPRRLRHLPFSDKKNSMFPDCFRMIERQIDMIQEQFHYDRNHQQRLEELERKKQEMMIIRAESKEKANEAKEQMADWRNNFSNVMIEALTRIRRQVTEKRELAASMTIERDQQLNRIKSQILNNERTIANLPFSTEQSLHFKNYMISKNKATIKQYNQRLVFVKQTIRKIKFSQRQKLCSIAKNNWDFEDSNYFFLELIGVGGYSEVYRCYDIKNEREVGFKISICKECEDTDKLKVFNKLMIQEYEIQKNLDHPNIGRVYSQFTLEGYDNYYNVFELYQGPELSDYIQYLQYIEQDEAKELLRQILNGLQYLHSHGVIHFDLKSKNIMFHQGVLKIIDFGISRKLAVGETEIELQHQGYGTFSCLPPQALQSNSRITTKVDMFSVGVLFYEMLYGEKPFKFYTHNHALMSYKFNDNAVEIKFPQIQNRSVVSEGAKEFILNCLKFDQTERYSVQDALECDYLKL